MSDLWSLAAYRLKATGRSCAEVAFELNQLPKFRRKRASFDADSARKAIKEGSGLVRDSIPRNRWEQFLLECKPTSKAVRARRRFSSLFATE